MEAPILIGFTPARSFGPSSGARSRWVFRSPPLCAGIRGALSLLTCRLYRLSSESDGCISSGVAPLYVLRRGVSGWSCHLCEFHVSLMRRTSSMLFDVSVRLLRRGHDGWRYGGRRLRCQRRSDLVTPSVPLLHSHPRIGGPLSALVRLYGATLSLTSCSACLWMHPRRDSDSSPLPHRIFYSIAVPCWRRRDMGF